MTDKSIKCPECGAEIEISAVLSRQIEDDLKNTLRLEHEARLKRATEEVRARSQQEFTQVINELQKKLSDQEHVLLKTREKEIELNAKAQQLEAQRERLDKEVEQRLLVKEQALRTQLSEQARQETALEISDLREQLKEKSNTAELAQKRELEIRKQARLLEDRQKNFDLELQRRIDENRHEIEQKLASQFADETNLKLMEKEKQINDLRKSLEEAKRKSEQGSVETQGEVLELDLESRLSSLFVNDQISPVPKGIRGADVVQTVKDSSFNECGKIIWETKNTKNWSTQWIQKLKDDQREIGANLAILVSITLPENIKGFGMMEGVWIADIQSYLPLATAMREQLIQVSFARNASQGKSEKMEMMFNYLSGDEFRQRVEAIVETFNEMQDQLNREKRAMERIWKERDKQIQRITANTIGMYGDVRGIIGSSIQSIPALELDDEVSEPTLPFIKKEPSNSSTPEE